MNIESLTRIGLVYIQEAVLAVLLEAKENGAAPVSKKKIAKKMRMYPNVDTNYACS